MDLKKRIEEIRKGESPEHIAIIPDGNGRWATQRGYERTRGHRKGSQAAEKLIEFVSNQLPIKYLTFYTFSTENWSRPDHEVKFLMILLRKFLKDKGIKLTQNNVRLRIIGDLQDLPKKTVAIVRETIDKTMDNDGLQLVMALNYGGRREILRAAKQITTKIVKGKIGLQNLTEDLFRSNLFAPDIPDPDLLIRTSGERRLSNFMLWQLAYTELWFTDTLWPSFSSKDLLDALRDYQSRDRRFGHVEERKNKQ